MKQKIKSFILACIQRASRLFYATRIGGLVGEGIISDVMQRVQMVEHHGVSMAFTIPNRLNQSRADSFATKEPETLEWIDGLPGACILWDVGANVGLYSVYAAKKRGCKVVAFEPSVFNLELLARNLFLNGLQNQVGIAAVALSDGLGMNQMRMTSTDWGGALSSFGQDFGWDGNSIATNFTFQTIGISMDEAVSVLQLPAPAYIKMDVDGIEHIILRGGAEVLSQIRGILVEINDGFEEQGKEAEQILRAAGLRRQAKLHAPMIADSAFAEVYNQIWVRD